MKRFRVGGRILLLIAVTLLFVCGFAVITDMLELIPVLAIPCMGWCAWRAFRISTLGTVLLVVTLELATGFVSLIYRSVGSTFDFMWATLLLFPSIGGMLSSVVAFLIEAYRSTSQRRRNLVAAALACLLPILWVHFGGRGAGVLNEWLLQRAIARSEIPAVIAELNAVTERLGRAPKDEKELQQFLGKPLPDVPGRGSIEYHAAGGKHFVLEFGYDAGGYVFDSEKPDEGWHCFFGGALTENDSVEEP